jgi:Fe-S-cluster containining protein
MDQAVASSSGAAVRSTIPDEHAALKQLERQVERGQLFEHTALGESFRRLGEAETFLHGLLDLLLAKEIVTDEELREAAAGVRQELIERGQLSGPGTAIGIEDLSQPAPLAVDCEKRMHICHAVCCKLHFALTIPEIESTKIKWDLGRPYFIRQTDGGLCIHNDDQTGRCGVYSDRPAACQKYSCVNDERIWKNFERMELNEEWIESHLSQNVTRDAKGTRMNLEPLVQIQPRAARRPPANTE